MKPLLVALAGPSRSGKGTCASIFTEEAQALGLTVCERQLSGPGKQYVASAWRPDITEAQAIEWFDELKQGAPRRVSIGSWIHLGWEDDAECTLQQYLQRMLQGARDRWGEDFWIDKLLPKGAVLYYPAWTESFEVHDDPEGPLPADLCLISDLRQINEARRVHDHEVGGFVIEMRRPPIKHSYVTDSAHITEQRLLPELVDYAIEGFADHNDETLEILKQRCRAAWTSFVLPRLES